MMLTMASFMPFSSQDYNNNNSNSSSVPFLFQHNTCGTFFELLVVCNWISFMGTGGRVSSNSSCGWFPFPFPFPLRFPSPCKFFSFRVEVFCIVSDGE